MSDTSPGPGWWQASDGNWYPPEEVPELPRMPRPPSPQAPPEAGELVDSPDDLRRGLPTSESLPDRKQPAELSWNGGCPQDEHVFDGAGVCSSCGQPGYSGASYCAFCGSPLTSSGDPPLPPGIEPHHSPDQRTSRQGSASRQMSRSKLAGIGIGVAIVIAVVSVLILMSGHGHNVPTSASSGPSTTGTTTVMEHLIVNISNQAVIGGPDWSAVVTALASGVPVTVANQAGVVIGTNGDVFGSASFQVPDDPFYKITVGTFGTITFSRADLESNNWHADVAVS